MPSAPGAGRKAESRANVAWKERVDPENVVHVFFVHQLF
jgi:hypothetical protein